MVTANGNVNREMNARGEKQMLELNGLTPGYYYVRKISQAGVETKLLTIAR